MLCWSKYSEYLQCFSWSIGNLTRICLGTPVHVSTALVKRELAAATHSPSSPVNTAEGVFRLADDLRRERVSEGVDRIMASPVAVDRRPIRVITGWHLPGRDHNDNGRFAGKTSSYTLSARALAVLSCTISFGRINSTFPSLLCVSTLSRPNRRVTPLWSLWLFVTVGDCDVTSYRGPQIHHARLIARACDGSNRSRSGYAFSSREIAWFLPNKEKIRKKRTWINWM